MTSFSAQSVSPSFLAHHHREGRGPTIVFLPGYASDMSGSKALALDGWAAANGRPMLRFDYSGCGDSPGDFEAQSLARWRDDTLGMIDEIARGPVVLVGSSLGGWLMLHAALARPDRVAGLVGIAAAPDFTGWGFTEDEKMTILTKGRIERPNPYGDTPTVTSRVFWESGEAMRITHGPIAVDCPVRLLHGQADPDVPWAWSLRIAELVRSPDVRMTLVKDGDHRLSRDADLVLLIQTVAALVEQLDP